MPNLTEFQTSLFNFVKGAQGITEEEIVSRVVAELDYLEQIRYVYREDVKLFPSD